MTLTIVSFLSEGKEHKEYAAIHQTTDKCS